MRRLLSVVGALLPSILVVGSASAGPFKDRHDLSADAAPPSVLGAPGYTGLFNTPTARTTPLGGARLGLADTIPEMERTIAAGVFGSVLLSAAPLPGIEGAIRLAVEGDPGCSFFVESCAGTIRDLSVGAKYTLPIVLPLGTRLALGVTDVGGAATNFRQVYAVASSQLGPLDASLGLAHRADEGRALGLMDGVFGSATLRVMPDWILGVEHDTREVRVGTVRRVVLSDVLALQLGVSRKLTDTTPQQAWQLNAVVDVVLGAAPAPPRPLVLDPFAPSVDDEATAPTRVALRAHAGAAPAANTASNHTSRPPTRAAVASIANALVAAGFADVSVRAWQGPHAATTLWEIEAEPRAWRRSRMEAAAAALGVWSRHDAAAQGGDRLVLTLTFQQLPTMHMLVNTECFHRWLGDRHACSASNAVSVVPPHGLPDDVQATLGRVPDVSVDRAAGTSWVPQFEFSPALRTAVGTELAAFDAALALELGAEVQLLPGLLAQAVVSTPASATRNFMPGEPLMNQGFPEPGLDVALLTLWAPLPWGLAMQANAGSIDRDHLGAQADVAWVLGDGRVRLGGTWGRFHHRLKDTTRMPALGSARISVWPGTWHVEATGGQFLSGDRGFSLTSRHWFGQVALAASYRDTEVAFTDGTAQRRRLLGFSISLPLDGPRVHSLGPVTLRGRDRWSWGLQTKVGDADNALSRGFGVVPRIRHGLWTDVLDHDRNSPVDIEALRDQLRDLVLEYRGMGTAHQARGRADADAPAP